MTTGGAPQRGRGSTAPSTRAPPGDGDSPSGARDVCCGGLRRRPARFGTAGSVATHSLRLPKPSGSRDFKPRRCTFPRRGASPAYCSPGRAPPHWRCSSHKTGGGLIVVSNNGARSSQDWCGTIVGIPIASGSIARRTAESIWSVSSEYYFLSIPSVSVRHVVVGTGMHLL